MKRIMFTGEQGNLARNIALTLSVFDKLIEVVEVGPEFKAAASLHHPWPELDVTKPEFRAAVRLEKPDVIVHTAAVVNTDKCWHAPARSVEVNLLGTQAVVEACREVGADLVYFSTTATYDPQEDERRPYTELSRQRPPTLYGITKYAGEMLVTGLRDVRWLVIRPCFIYGNPPFDHSSQLCRVAVHSLLRSRAPHLAAARPPQVTLDPEALKDYMRVEDFADAVAKLLVNDFWGQTFNVSYGKPRPMGWYFEQLEEMIGRLHFDWVPSADYMGDHVVSSARLTALTGWGPKIGPTEGIAKLARAAEWYVKKFEKDGAAEPLLYR